MTEQLQQLLNNANAPAWLTPQLVLVAGGVVVAIILLWLISLTFRRSPARGDAVAPVYYEEEVPPARPITPPPPIAPVFAAPAVEAPLMAPPAAPEPVIYAPAPEPEPVVEAAPEPEVTPEPAAEPFEVTLPPAFDAAEPEPAPEPVAEPEAPVAMPAPELVHLDTGVAENLAPEPLADELIAANIAEPAAPEPAPVDEPAPVFAPEPVAAPVEPAAPAPAVARDELTRMKGVGPRLADRLNTVGITSFAQIAALTPAGAEALDARLGDFQGRMHRDRWIEQATFLAVGDIDGFEGTFGKL